MITSILIKPTGPDCNLRCNYCFYRQKAGMFQGKQHRMSDEVLETLIRDALRSGVSTFSWQGGEPTLMGLDFFKKVVQMEMQYGAPGGTVANALQTNTTLIDEEWAAFLAQYKFLVGVSLDGPKRIHDHYRRDVDGKGTHDRIVRNMQILANSGVEFNVLVLLNDLNVKQPDAVYDFLKSKDIYFMQFVPCIEPGGKGTPAAFSIDPDDYGDFLVRVFDRWVEDFPNVSIRDFDDLLLRELGRPPSTCMVSDHCADYVVVEHNGDVFTCDFFVISKWKLGNIMETPFGEIINSEKLAEFKKQKSDLGPVCMACSFLRHCYGGCQKHRVVLGGDYKDPSYFCRAYKKLYTHALPVMPGLVKRLQESGRL